jgi:glyoxylase-like metal-dependent hydrolase (beta-lactamase superfamily II)
MDGGAVSKTQEPLEDRIHLFAHGGTEGALLKILDDDPHSLNELLPESHRLSEDQTLPFAYTCCYVRHRGRHVMIDGGIDGDEVAAQLAMLDVTPADIDLVLITHVDRDHVAGLILQVGDGELAYPNAQYAIDADLWAELQKDETYEELPKHLQRLFKALTAQLADRVILCEGETEVTDGITFVPAPGHRPGHAAYEFATDDSPILHMGDAFFHPIFMEHFDWPVTGDTSPDEAVETRMALIERIESAHPLLIGTHFPWPGIGRVSAVPSDAIWIPATG